MTAAAQELALGGAVGAMALGAMLTLSARRSDFVALWLGLFLACVSASLLSGRASAAGQWSELLALPSLACFLAAQYPGLWQRRGAIAVAVLSAASAALGALVVVRGLGLTAAVWGIVAAGQLARERHSAWPAMNALIGLGYAALLLDLFGPDGLAPAGLIAFVLAPGVMLTRRAIRAYDAEARRVIDQAKFTAEVFDLVPVALSMRDRQGRYRFVNKTWEKYYGHSRESVIGTTPSERASGEEVDKLLALDRAALEAGPGVSLPPRDFLLQGRRFLQTRTAMADSRGQLLGVLIASIDTTERAAMEQALATEQRRLELVVRASNAGILDWDGYTRTVYYSPRFKEILRYPPDADSSGWPDYFEVVHPEDRERVQGRFREHILAVKPTGSAPDLHRAIEYRLRRADGSYVWIEAFGVSVRDERGYAARFIAAITDIDARRAQEEALRAAVRLREEVERLSRHDLKTPLNSVVAMARLLRESESLSARTDELLRGIERAAYRVLNMANLSLDIFRMEQSSYEFRPQPVDIALLARRVADDLESQAASKGVALTVRDGGTGAARGEELLCYSMFANLIKNALEAAPDGGTVSIEVERQGDAVLAHVHNAGAVPEPIRASFFQKYSTFGKSTGLGLGTYSARLMARVQEGDITLRTSEEEGTTLTVRLARASQASALAGPAPSAVPRAAPQPAPDLPVRRVLVVDDDEFNRLALRHCLPSPPFEVDLAVNGRAALDAARRAWPEVVFLDLEMPVMDGYQAASRLREMEREGGHPRCTIVAISSNDDQRIVELARAAGCDHYLVKPAPREALLHILAVDTPRAGSIRPQGPGVPPMPDAERSRPGAGPGPEDPVEVDADLRHTLPRFIASRNALLDELGAAIEAGDREAARRVAHKLAGSFGLYGFTWAASESQALQHEAASVDLAELRRRCDSLRRHLDLVRLSAATTT